MCGIGGIVSGNRPVEERWVERMLAAQRHRGPDASGTWSSVSGPGTGDGRRETGDGLSRSPVPRPQPPAPSPQSTAPSPQPPVPSPHVVLGHRRLAILDLSEAGRQPLSNEDGTVWVTFNGEIYNFQVLRADLEARGHTFRSRTDTEVIVHAYEEWGTDCVRRFRGMFAFGLWDTRRHRLFLARDRVGKKPLFYTHQGDRFLFASELQGLLADPDVPREVDPVAIDQYLTWGYVPAPRTGFQGIHKLPPAHWLLLEDPGLTAETQRAQREDSRQLAVGSWQSVVGSRQPADCSSPGRAASEPLPNPPLSAGEGPGEGSPNAQRPMPDVHTPTHPHTYTPTHLPAPKIERYWSLEYSPKLQISEGDAAEALREKLTDAVRLRMVSDVPLGAFLSGGIDSSIVVGLMAGLSERPVRTFSIGFEDAAYNELPHARRIAERWSTEHQELVVQPDALAVLPRLVRHYGEPYADSSAVPTYYVSEITRRSVTVALNGDGGDESFAGYERYLAHRVAEQVRRAPGSRLAAGLLARALPDSLDPKSRVRNLRRFLTVAHEPAAERYGAWVGGYFREAAKARLYAGDLRALLAGERPGEWLASLFDPRLDPADQAMAVDVQSYLPYDLLVKVDITSMANSLEARSPFLDHELMEWAARLPVGLKLRGRTAKYLPKRAFPDLLPPENVNRRKMGFGVPLARWLRGPLRELLRDSLLSERSLGRGYFRPEEVRRLVTEHLEARADHSFQLWSLLMLELWHVHVVEDRSLRS